MKGVVLASFLVEQVPHARVLIANDACGERFYDISEVSIFNNGQVLVLWPAVEAADIVKQTGPTDA